MLRRQRQAGISPEEARLSFSGMRIAEAKTSTQLRCQNSNMMDPGQSGFRQHLAQTPAHNRHYVRSLATLTSAHKCRYVRLALQMSSRSLPVDGDYLVGA